MLPRKAISQVKGHEDYADESPTLIVELNELKRLSAKKKNELAGHGAHYSEQLNEWSVLCILAGAEFFAVLKELSRQRPKPL